MPFAGLLRANVDYNPRSSNELQLKRSDLLFQLDHGADGHIRCMKSNLDRQYRHEGLVWRQCVTNAVPVKRARAAQDIVDSSRSGLSVWRGSKLQIYDDSSPDWKLIGVNGRYGFVPSSYVTTKPPKFYMYSPLDPKQQEIRLLTVHGEASSPDGSVLASMATVSLAREPKPYFEAISYAWGSSRVRSSIMVDGRLLTVPASAECALRNLRFKEDCAQTLWIDAVCINQKDIEERSSQVGIMHNIYWNAARCLVWLGEGHNNAEPAFVAVLQVLHDAANETDTFSKFDNMIASPRNGAYLYSTRA